MNDISQLIIPNIHTAIAIIGIVEWVKNNLPKIDRVRPYFILLLCVGAGLLQGGFTRTGVITGGVVLAVVELGYGLLIKTLKDLFAKIAGDKNNDSDGEKND